MEYTEFIKSIENELEYLKQSGFKIVYIKLDETPEEIAEIIRVNSKAGRTYKFDCSPKDSIYINYINPPNFHPLYFKIFKRRLSLFTKDNMPIRYVKDMDDLKNIVNTIFK